MSSNRKFEICISIIIGTNTKNQNLDTRCEKGSVRYIREVHPPNISYHGKTLGNPGDSLLLLEVKGDSLPTQGIPG